MILTHEFKPEKQYDFKSMIFSNSEYLTNHLFGMEDKVYNMLGEIIEPMSFTELNFFYNILIEDITIIDFDYKYEYRPTYVSIDMYQTNKLAHLIMFINSVAEPYEFTEEKLNGKIIIPSKTAIKQVETLVKSPEYAAEKIVKFNYDQMISMS